jgi:hypothetical protein
VEDAKVDYEVNENGEIISDDTKSVLNVSDGDLNSSDSDDNPMNQELL